MKIVKDAEEYEKQILNALALLNASRNELENQLKTKRENCKDIHLLDAETSQLPQIIEATGLQEILFAKYFPPTELGCDLPKFQIHQVQRG